MPARIVLIRHGETDWNAEDRYQGQLDPPLNRRGIAQARRLAEELKGAGLQALYSSPLQRALQTAEIISQALDIPLHTDPRLKEIRQGEWEGLLRSEIAARYPELFRRWLEEPWAATPPGGESLAQVRERVIAAVSEIASRHRGEKVGVVTHLIPIYIIKAHYQGLTFEALRGTAFPNGGWEELTIRNSPFAIHNSPFTIRNS